MPATSETMAAEDVEAEEARLLARLRRSRSRVGADPAPEIVTPAAPPDQSDEDEDAEYLATFPPPYGGEWGPADHAYKKGDRVQVLTDIYHIGADIKAGEVHTIHGPNPTPNDGGYLLDVKRRDGRRVNVYGYNIRPVPAREEAQTPGAEREAASDAYLDFLRAKVATAPDAGFEVAEEEVNPILLPHQRAIVRWAIRGGRRAIFAAFGLGKSVIQLEILRLTLKKLGKGRALIIAPLGVRQEFARDAAMLGIPLTFVRRSEDVSGSGLYITNYESVRDGRLDPNLFGAVSLDEASVLRSFGSLTYQTFLTLFDALAYRFVATATPSPNRFKELIHYAAFLGIMDSGQALTRFFQRNSEKANDLTLYPHKEREFWLWLNSWAVFVQRPSDLGFSDEGYDLPELTVHYHEVESDHASAKTERNGQARMFRDASLGLPDAAGEKRSSLAARVAKAAEILAQDPDSHYLLWHHLEAERHAIQAAVPEAVSVWGTQDLEEREARIVGFSEGRFKYLSTKPEIAGSGCNFQRHCHKAIFVGIDYKANDFMQAVHRIQRFQQARPCEVHVIHTEAERDVLRALLDKWQRHKEMTQTMTSIIREHGLNRLSVEGALARTIGVERTEVSGKRFRLANNDAVLEARSQGEGSVDLVVTSIPFANHYEYTPSYNDFGHTEGNPHFWQQMDFLTPELRRILQPGRLYCCHVKDRINFGNITGEGVPTVSPFHAEAIFHGIKHGFQYLGMITVVTDVVRENNQTYRLGWSENAKDGTKMGVGSPEYVLLFRKPQTDRSKGYADTPVRKDKSAYTRARWQVDAHAFWRSSGDRLLRAEELAGLGPDQLASLYTRYSLEGVYDYEFHVKLGEELEARGALPSTFMSLAPGSHHPEVWHDVNRMRTLNGTQSQKGLALHVCPLQFDIVDRLIERYSMPGELVYDPFAGIGTVPYRAVLKGRRGAGSELNTAYFQDAVRYLQAAEAETGMPSLFDIIQAEGDSIQEAPEIIHAGQGEEAVHA